MVQTSGRTGQLSRSDFMDLRRIHVTDPLKWGVQVGTDFWAIAGANGQGTASGNNLLTDGGWTVTSISHTAGSGADLMSSADVGTPSEYTQNAQNDLIQSPAIFGDYSHAHAAAVILGQKALPRFIVADIFARFSVVANDQATTNLGFVEDGGSIVTAADGYATINSDGTNFRLNINGTRATTRSIAVTTASAWFRIVLDKGAALASAYKNGTLLGSAAITDDEAPVSFGAGSGGANNLVQLNQVHIFYAWSLPFDPAVF